MTTTITRQLLRLATAGSVDDGKSTLIGRLLHDTDSLPTDHLDSVTDEHGVADLAALSDGLRAEREQGITIDVAYRFFSTPTRSYVLADTPGGARTLHAQHVHRSIQRSRSGPAGRREDRRVASDAPARQNRRTARCSEPCSRGEQDRSGGLRRSEIRSGAGRIAGLARQVGREDVLAIPVSAKAGDNVVTRSENTAWYEGPTLLEYLEGVELHAPATHIEELRLPVQWVSRPRSAESSPVHRPDLAGTLSVGER